MPHIAYSDTTGDEISLWAATMSETTSVPKAEPGAEGVNPVPKVTEQPEPVAARDFQAVSAFAYRGHGIGLLPSTYCDAQIARGELVRLLPDWSSPEIFVHAVYPTRRLLPAKLQLFLEALKAWKNPPGFRCDDWSGQLAEFDEQMHLRSSSVGLSRNKGRPHGHWLWQHGPGAHHIFHFRRLNNSNIEARRNRNR